MPAADPLKDGIAATCGVPDNLGTPRGGNRSDCVCVGKKPGKRAWLTAVDAASGAQTVIASDKMATYAELAPPTDPQSWYATRDGQDIFWWSERDGWAHFYRYGPDGKVKNPLTSGPWFASAISYVDETARQVYFTARGREAGEFWYYAKLYRVNYDGTGLTRLTPEDGHHQIDFSPSGMPS